jgi:A/G-specific adenine glycosylase
VKVRLFKKKIWEFYKKHARKLPWRDDISFYSIVISEIMLQQTQVKRVLGKYAEFIQEFPSFEALHKAELKEVLRVWQGMGYNRRALWLKKIASEIVTSNTGYTTPKELTKLPGIGVNTAGSIAAFAFNYPSIFIETNIRRVFIYHFFEGAAQVSDKQILSIVQETLDKDSPREWYWALMDYGSYLSSVTDNPNKKSKHYTIQSKFEGSKRQVRGQILRVLQTGKKSLDELILLSDTHNVKQILDELAKEGMIKYIGNMYEI